MVKFQHGSLFFGGGDFGDSTVDTNRSPGISKVDVDCRLGSKELPLVNGTQSETLLGALLQLNQLHLDHRIKRVLKDSLFIVESG